MAWQAAMWRERRDLNPLPPTVLVGVLPKAPHSRSAAAGAATPVTPHEGV